ncbi:DUF389 domain-containing protein [Pseudovibrio japonicus]|nr:DUF389 domain-containing protein [Pseudovibrio japonicus]
MSKLSLLKQKIASHLKTFSRRLSELWGKLRETPVSTEELHISMKRNAVPSPGFFLMLGLSGIIATLGMIANSAPTIIGAMIIAPLMSPIVSVAFGLAFMDLRLILISIFSIFTGTLLVIFIAYMGIEVIGVRIVGTEVLSRASPSMLDLGVALAAGCAAAFAQTRPSITNSIAGVAIAVALVPPLAASGIGLSLGAKATSETGLSLGEFGLYSGGYDIAAGAFLLFLTNLIGIIVIGTLVFVAQRYGDWRKALTAVAIISMLSFLFVPTLQETLHEIYVKNRVIRLAVKRSHSFTDNGAENLAQKIESVNVNYLDGMLNVNIVMFLTREHMEGAQARLDDFRRVISEEIGEPIAMEVDVIPIDFLRLRSSQPKPTK